MYLYHSQVYNINAIELISKIIHRTKTYGKFTLHKYFVCMCGSASHARSSCGGLKRAENPLELELPSIVRHPVGAGNQLRSSRRTAWALNR